MGVYQERLIRELRKTDLAERTHESYIREIRRFYSRPGAMTPAQTVEEHVTDWLLELKDRGYAPSSINMAKCGLQFFFTKVIPKDDWTIFKQFKAGKRNNRRPSLSVREVWKILNSIRTLHNRAALTVIYLCGLRISECVNLQCGDIHRDEGMLNVHRGKGARSRTIPLPQLGIELLTEHWKAHRNQTLLFPAMGRGMCKENIRSTTDVMPLSSIQTVFNKAAKAAGVNRRRLSVHSLRHSYATHLLELGVPVEHLKKLMGHSNISTTEGYLHITPSGYKDTIGKIHTLAEEGRKHG